MALGPSIPIVIQPGIQPGVPGTIGNLTKFSSGSPPEFINDSILRQVTVGLVSAIIVGATDPESTANETFRTVGGIISEGGTAQSTVLGEGAHVSGSQDLGSLALGTGASLSFGTNPEAFGQSIAVGPNNRFVNDASGGECGANVLVGAGNTVTQLGTTNLATVIGVGNTLTQVTSIILIGSAFTGSGFSSAIGIGNGISGMSANDTYVGHNINGGASGTDNVIIGRGAGKTGGGNSNVIIGRATAVTGGNDFGVAIGAGAVVNLTGGTAVGRNSLAATANSMALGTSADTTGLPGYVVVGGANTGGNFSGLLLGKGDTNPVPVGFTIRFTNSTGADLAAGDATIQAPVSTGNAVPGAVTIQVGQTGASSSTLQTLREGFRVQGTATSVFARVAQGAQAGALGALTVFGNNLGGNLVLGVSGAAGDLCTGIAANQAVIRTGSQALFFTVDGGTTSTCIVSALGVWQFQKDRGVRFDNQTSAAGANIGTLLNAPTAGDPGFWLKVNIGGTNYAIPAWAG